MDAIKAMLILKQFPGDPAIRLSEYTGGWYVEGVHVEIGGDGGLTTDFGGHFGSPETAALGALAALQSVSDPKYLVTHAASPLERRHWRWNGGAFVEIPKVRQ